MGIRVDKDALKAQLKARGEEYKLTNEFCDSVINDKIPLSVGGGIGQSRLCMFFLRKAHIGEVQCSLWPEDSVAECKKNGIQLL